MASPATEVEMDGPPMKDQYSSSNRRSSRIDVFDDEVMKRVRSDGVVNIDKVIGATLLKDEDGEASDSSHSQVEAHPPPGYKGSSTVRRNSQQSYADRMHTTMVLDWDDTLFPTTWVREDCRLDYRFHLHDQPELGPGDRRDTIESFLGKHLIRVDEFLAQASSLANVFIVTLAKRGWVDTTINNFMPGLAASVKKYTFKVIYAQEYAKPEEVMRCMTGASNMTAEQVSAFWTRVKGDAISKELDAFHKQMDVSWKNVISFGDSDFERYGTLAAGQDYMRREMEGGSVTTQSAHTTEGVSKDGHLKRLRVKTVKMLDKPTVLELTAELTLFRRWLPHIVQRDSGFDVEIEGTDNDQTLIELHRQVTGEEDKTLSWHELAGMTD